MSHFGVLVVTNTPQESVEEKLAPYHEYECTGIEDQYVVDIDASDEVSEFLAAKVFVGLTKASRTLDYEYHQGSADKNLISYETMTKAEYLAKAKLNVDEEIVDYFGFQKKEDGSWIKRTNPNSKWDWWMVGGRWTGYFTVHSRYFDEAGNIVDEDFAKFAEEAGGIYGERSLVMGPAKETRPTRVDRCRKKDIDLDAMKESLRTQAVARWDEEVKRSASSKNPVIEDGRVARNTPFSLLEVGENREEFIARQLEDFSLAPYAMITHGTGEWIERGSMGWFGISSNEMPRKDWEELFQNYWDGLSDDAVVTLVDCHI